MTLGDFMATTPTKMWFLLDANVTAGYYLPQCLGSPRAQDRISQIFNSTRSGKRQDFFYIPNFCVAEVFSVFMKHAFGNWNRHVQRNGKIDVRVYRSLVKQFESDIHNARFLYHYELSRYHVLGINLVAPIDHHFKISRGKRNVTPMGTFDHLIIAMGIHLARIHGPDNVCLLSADKRLTDVLAKCKSSIPKKTITKLKLNIAREVTGQNFDPKLFPKHLNLKTATKNDLVNVFGHWPLPLAKLPKVYRWIRQ